MRISRRSFRDGRHWGRLASTRAQTTVDYLGAVALVAALIAAAIAARPSVAGAVTGAFEEAICTVRGERCGGGGTEQNGASDPQPPGSPYGEEPGEPWTAEDAEPGDRSPAIDLVTDAGQSYEEDYQQCTYVEKGDTSVYTCRNLVELDREVSVDPVDIEERVRQEDGAAAGGGGDALLIDGVWYEGCRQRSGGGYTCGWRADNFNVRVYERNGRDYYLDAARATAAELVAAVECAGAGFTRDPQDLASCFDDIDQLK